MDKYIEDMQAIQKLKETLLELRELKKSFEHSGITLHTPSLDNHECCSPSVLECFRTMMPHLKAKNSPLHFRFSKSLKNPSIIKSVDLCKNSSQEEKKVCQKCDSYPKKDSREFVRQLESLLQKTMTTLM
ncbi:hypothetical protein DPEC_G00026880 [Dallia pectoralis]|uniref:Uncharacterized protein n=1 Tax=Dallia pectoralis TaxID=75939 RepID=A0ACC2HIE9_DALPE|nr:hypothetical protein DPEC_G00026880 [Dallia pectoralis]